MRKPLRQKKPLRRQSPKTSKRMRRELLDLWSLAVRQRDKHTCRICGSKSGVMQGHHILRKHRNASVQFAVDNGVCLCPGCHHRGAHDDPDNYHDTLVEHMPPGRFDELREAGRQRAPKMTKAFYEETKEKLMEEIRRYQWKRSRN